LDESEHCLMPAVRQGNCFKESISAKFPKVKEAI
jgi:hypothetical protein